MKTQKFLSKFFLLPIATLLFLTSCLDKQDAPPIAIGNYSFYVIQQTVGEEIEYLPHFGFWYNGKEELDHGIIAKDGEQLEIMTNTELMVCQLNPELYKTTSLEELNGTYTFNPVGKNGHNWERNFTVGFTNNNFVSDFGVTELSYLKGMVYVTFRKGATYQYYGLYIQPYINGSLTPYYAYVYPSEKITFYYSDVVSEDEIYMTLGFAFNPINYYTEGLTKFRITPIASKYSSEGGAKVIRLSSIYGEVTSDDYNKEIVFYTTEQPEE